MVENTLDRRWVLRGAGAAGAAAVGGLALAASASGSDTSQSSVLGSWLISHSDTLPGDSKPTKGIAGFAAGGVFLDVELSPGGGVGMGAWTGQGMDGFMGTFWTAGSAPGTSPGAATTVRVSPRGRVHGDQISGTYTIAVFDSSGTKVASGTGTFSGHRIMA